MHIIFYGYIPEEFAAGEPEVIIEIDCEKADPATRDCPSSPAIVEITRVTRAGDEVDLDKAPDGLMMHLEELAWDYLAEQHQRALAAREDREDRRLRPSGHGCYRGAYLDGLAKAFVEGMKGIGDSL